MQVYLNEITGIADALVSLSFSKRSWTREMEQTVRKDINDRFGTYGWTPACYKDKTRRLMESLPKFCGEHTTLMDMMTASVTVEGLHRAGQDDWDAHAKRYDNRIIRASTRLGIFTDGEMSDWYKGKIIPTDTALTMLGILLPSEVEKDGVKYVKGVNGYIREDLKNDKDVMRGLYMESIPSNFIFKVNLAQWCHVYRMRNKDSHANPEVKDVAEQLQSQIEWVLPWLTRDFALAVKI